MRNNNDEVVGATAALPCEQRLPLPKLRSSTICWQLCIAATVAIATNLDQWTLHVFPLRGIEASTTDTTVNAEPSSLSPWSFSSVTWIPEDGQSLSTGQDGPAITKKNSVDADNSTLAWPLPYTPTAVYYTYPRQDRSGSAIAEMLKAHAYCFMKGWEFGGVCGDTVHKKTNEKLIHAMGLGDIISYSCPKDKEQPDRYIDTHKYWHLEWKTFSPQWLNYMSGVPTISGIHNDDDIFRVAVHIRRGDVSLCTGNAWRRYSPNSHYLRLIDQVLANVPPSQPYKVTIYSESDHHDGKTKTQYETFDDFISRNYTVNLDRGLKAVWKSFIRSDVFIASKSGFSMVPAYLRYDRGGVIFTPHKFAYPLPHWDVVDKSFLAQTDADMEILQRERCPSNSTRRRTRRRLQYRDVYLAEN
jgi:hypothetical protein